MDARMEEVDRRLKDVEAQIASVGRRLDGGDGGAGGSDEGLKVEMLVPELPVQMKACCQRGKPARAPTRRY
jgi:hypothetical protein